MKYPLSIQPLVWKRTAMMLIAKIHQDQDRTKTRLYSFTTLNSRQFFFFLKNKKKKIKKKGKRKKKKKCYLDAHDMHIQVTNYPNRRRGHVSKNLDSRSHAAENNGALRQLAEVSV